MKKEIMKQLVAGAFVGVVIVSLIGGLVYVIPQQGNRQVPVQVQKGIEVIRNLTQAQDANFELLSWSDEGGIYKISFKLGDQQFESFITKNQKYFFPFGIDLTQEINQFGPPQDNTQQVEVNIPNEAESDVSTSTP